MAQKQLSEIVLELDDEKVNFLTGGNKNALVKELRRQEKDRTFTSDEKVHDYLVSLEQTYTKQREPDVLHMVMSLYSTRAEAILNAMGQKREDVMARVFEYYQKFTRGFLDEFSTDMLAKPHDPLILREGELQRSMTTLARRMKSNPALIGHPGVGKSAIARGLANAIQQGNVPARIKDWKMRQLDIVRIFSKSGVSGALEEICLGLLEEIRQRKEHGEEIILFVDELHMLVGGGGSGSQDMANIFKPALADGEIRLIGATTLDEYRKYIEEDGALARRFNPVYVREFTNEETIHVVNGILPLYEGYHELRASENVVKRAVELAGKFITDRYFPDKAIDLIDEAFSHVSMTTRRKTVTEDDISGVIARWLDIPTEKLTQEKRDKLEHIELELHKRLIGQEDAIMAVSSAIRRNMTGLSADGRPIGSFLFLGPTGVGKTELAKTLAHYLFDNDKNVVRLDMSEYNEPHSIARLFGAPPGYVGHDDGGHLTEPIRRRPYSVVLFDEIEKAHPNVFNSLLQVIGEGRMTDSKGRIVSFVNTVVIMTSNLLPELWTRGEIDRQELQGLLRGYFRPEFINRLDDMVVFRYLTQTEMIEIANLKLADLVRRARDFKLNISPDVAELLATQTYERDYGARPLVRAIDAYVVTPIAEAISAGEIEKGSTVDFRVVDDELSMTTKE